ncbi:MAG: SWIM zinc finger family protein [Anaerolineae bacterium]
MADTFDSALRSQLLAKRDHLKAQLRHSSASTPTTPASTSVIVLDQSWYTVTLSAERAIECSCGEFMQFHFCEHVLATWRKLQPSRATLVSQ